MSTEKDESNMISLYMQAALLIFLEVQMIDGERRVKFNQWCLNLCDSERELEQKFTQD